MFYHLATLSSTHNLIHLLPPSNTSFPSLPLHSTIIITIRYNLVISSNSCCCFRSTVQFKISFLKISIGYTLVDLHLVVLVYACVCHHKILLFAIIVKMSFIHNRLNFTICKVSFSLLLFLPHLLLLIILRNNKWLIVSEPGHLMMIIHIL